MAAIPGQLDASTADGTRRSAPRRTLHLQAQETASTQTSVLILDISTTGLLLQTSGDLAVDETIELELPGAPTVSATVKWSRGGLYGCQFAEPVSDAFVSAALLRSPPRPPIPGLVSGPDPEAIEAHGRDSVGKLSGAARIGWIVGLTVLSWILIAALLFTL